MRNELTKIRGYFRYLVLYVLSERPLHGYGIMKRIEEIFQLDYTPSPGILYPTLHLLERLGLIQSRIEGRRRVYCLTELGRKILEEHRAEIESFIDKVRRARNMIDELGLGTVLETVKRLWEKNIVLPQHIKEKIRYHIQEISRILNELLDNDETA